MDGSGYWISEMLAPVKWETKISQGKNIGLSEGDLSRGGHKLSNRFFQAFLPGLGADPEMLANMTAVKGRKYRARSPGGIISSGHRLDRGCRGVSVQTVLFILNARASSVSALSTWV